MPGPEACHDRVRRIFWDGAGVPCLSTYYPDIFLVPFVF